MARLKKGDPGYRRMIVLIVALGAAPPTATDMYLPALPQMTEMLDASESLVNLTLIGFFLFVALGTLVFGPLSDKYGRKKPLFIAAAMFTIAGVAAGLSTNVWALIAARVVQGVGGGGMVAISTALVKDCFEGRVREKVLVVIQAAGVIAPMCAPVLGAFVLEFANWHFTFFSMAGLGAFCLGMIAVMKDPLELEDRVNTGIARTVGKLFVVGRNKSFLALLLMVTLLSASFMGYLSSASYIYIDYFGLTTFEYSAFFAANASLSFIGATLALVIGKLLAVKRIISCAIAFTFVAGVSLLLFGSASPFVFLAAFGMYSLATSTLRPFTMNLLLEQQDKDTGSASSLINVAFNISGSIGMGIAGLPWANYITGLGIMISAGALMALAVWVFIRRSKLLVRGL